MEISFVWADVRLFVDLRLTSRGGERRGGGGGGGGRKRLKRRESIRGWKKGDELKGRSGNLSVPRFITARVGQAFQKYRWNNRGRNGLIVIIRGWQSTIISDNNRSWTRSRAPLPPPSPSSPQLIEIRNSLFHLSRLNSRRYFSSPPRHRSLFPARVSIP